MWWNKRNKKDSKLSSDEYYQSISKPDRVGCIRQKQWNFSFFFLEDYKGYIVCNSCIDLKDRYFNFDLLDLGSPAMKEIHNFLAISNAQILEVFVEWRKNETKQTARTMDG